MTDADVPFSIDVRREDPYAIVAVAGDVDLATVPQLRETVEELLQAGDARIVIDLSHVTFLDSAGLGLLVVARRQVEAAQGTLAVVCRDARILQLFQMTKLDDVLDIRASLEEATARH